MPKLACPCGFIHDLSHIPDDGWNTIKDGEYDTVIEAERIVAEISATPDWPSPSHPRSDEYDAAASTVVSKSGSIYECPDCGRLMWKRPGDAVFRVFMPERQGGA